MLHRIVVARLWRQMIPAAKGTLLQRLLPLVPVLGPTGRLIIIVGQRHLHYLIESR